MSKTLAGKTLFVTGATRGIGHAIAMRAARDGANIGVIGKTDQPHPKLPGTVHSAVSEIREAGGQAIGCVCDIRDETQVVAAVNKVATEFGGIDIVVNNASAIQLTGTADTEMKRFDLMHAVNVRGTFLTTRSCLKHLMVAENAHVLNISPPLNMLAHWFEHHVAYTMSKYGMSMCVLGMAAEFADAGIAVNALWPKTAIATSAVLNLLGGESAMQMCRKPEIVSDAAWQILTSDARTHTGNFYIDEDVLRENGETDFDRYAMTPDGELMPDFFL